VAEAEVRRLRQAVLLMVGSSVLFALMAVAIRLASSELHPFQIAFFRNFFGLIFALPILYAHGFAILRTDKLGLYVTRCAIGIASMLCGFWALVNLPLAQAVALSYSTPLFVTIFAVLILHEVVRARRWTAVALGFVGVLVIVQPGTEGFTLASLVAVAAAILSALVSISIKFLSRTEPPDAIVLYTTMIWVPMSLLPALPYWQWPGPLGWIWVAAAGACGTFAHQLWTRALKRADASVVSPIGFVQLPVVAVLGWLVFGEVVGIATALGSALIFAATFYIARREAQIARRAVTDPDIGSEPPALR
jgi:drug/metabolite transporter (DMT)-like permease